MSIQLSIPAVSTCLSGAAVPVVGSRRQASIAGKYAGGVFCNLPDGAVVMCRYAFHYEDSDFQIGDAVMLVIQRYDEGKKQIFGKIVGKV